VEDAADEGTLERLFHKGIGATNEHEWTRI
jgi:hypothetical protein